MYRTRTLLSLVTAALVALPVAGVDAQAPSKPVTPEQVAKNTERESKRVANRTGKAVRKAGRQTEKQAKRTAKSVERLWSREARRGNADRRAAGRRRARAVDRPPSPRVSSRQSPQ